MLLLLRFVLGGGYETKRHSPDRIDISSEQAGDRPSSMLKVVPINPPANPAYVTDRNLPFKQHAMNRDKFCQQSMCFARHQL